MKLGEQNFHMYQSFATHGEQEWRVQEVQKKLQSSENSITVSFQHPSFDILHSNFLNQILGKLQTLSEVFFLYHEMGLISDLWHRHHGFANYIEVLFPFGCNILYKNKYWRELQNLQYPHSNCCYNLT
jgi:hypothetical protein